MANKRKGGLVGLAATAIGLNKEVHTRRDSRHRFNSICELQMYFLSDTFTILQVVHHLPQLIEPVLDHFQDPDTRVRCTACETMYNVAKVNHMSIRIHPNSWYPESNSLFEVAKSHTLPYFNKIFMGLASLAGDQEVHDTSDSNPNPNPDPTSNCRST